MDILFVLGAFIGSTGVSVITSAVKARKQTVLVRLLPQTKAELFLEQKELGRWLISEVAHLRSNSSVSKETVASILQQLHLLYTSAYLMTFSNKQIESCLSAADMAMRVLPYIDQKYLYILEKLTEAVVTSVLRASGEKERVTYCQKTVTSLARIAPAFQNLSSGITEMNQWKNNSSNRNQGMK